MSVYRVFGTNRKGQRRALRVRAWLNGQEVTSRCFYADPRRGVVRLYLLCHGRPYVDRATHTAAQETRRGRVIVRRK